MPEIIHDIGALVELKGMMVDVYMDIIGPQRSDFEFSASEAGHQRAADAIISFYEGWEDGRKKVSDSLYNRIQNLKTVIAGYEDLEANLSGAFGSSSTAGRTSQA